MVRKRELRGWSRFAAHQAAVWLLASSLPSVLSAPPAGSLSRVVFAPPDAKCDRCYRDGNCQVDPTFAPPAIELGGCQKTYHRCTPSLNEAGHTSTDQGPILGA